MNESGNEHYSVTVKLNMHITQLKSWKDSEQQKNAYVTHNCKQATGTRDPRVEV